MRKFIFLLCAVVAMTLAAGCTQCSNDAPWGVEYSLNSYGDTDASVSVTFINGEFDLRGDAKYGFTWTNSAKPEALRVNKDMQLERGVESNDPQIRAAAKYVNSWMEDAFKIAAFEGHYDIYVVGYVKETKTQITFTIDRHFTNLPEGE